MREVHKGLTGKNMILRTLTSNPIRRCYLWAGFVLLLVTSVTSIWAQVCFNGPDLDAPTRTAIESAARKYLDMSVHGDVAGLKANAIPAIAGDFSSIEQAVVTNKEFLAGGPASMTGTYLLDASQAKATLPRADFYCGIFNSADRIGFFIPNLPPGRYAMVFQKVDGKDPITLTLILQEMGGGWKLAGYYPRLDAIGGHDGQWYLAKAREYKGKGQAHNAWFYYLTAWDLLAPVNFMSTPQLDKVSDEMQAARPADLPSNGSTMSLSTGGGVFKVAEIAPVAIDNNLYLRMVYSTADVTNARLTNQDNLAVIKALVAKYPEVRDAFYAVVARAVDASGHDFVTMMGMKEIR